MMDIVRKPLADVTWADFQALEAAQVEESQFLEFKSGLLLEPPNGKHEAAKAACKALVAFANSYGGTFLLGIEDGTASLQYPVKSVAAEAEKLERSILSRVDPPIAGLEVRAFDRGDGNGIIAVRVPSSLASPHGFGTPPEAYLRVGKNSRPMTMRDMQGLFWEARTRQERVEAIRRQQADEFAAMRAYVERHGISPWKGDLAQPADKTVCLRVTAIPQQRLNLSPIPKEKWAVTLRPTRSLIPSVSPAFGTGAFSEGVRRIAHGVCGIDTSARWTVLDDGTVSVLGSKASQAVDGGGVHHPIWYSAVVAQVLVMTDRVRRSADLPEVSYEVDCQIAVGKQVTSPIEDDLHFQNARPLILNATIGPFLLTDRSSIEAVFDSLERELYGFFGIDRLIRTDVSWPPT